MSKGSLTIIFVILSTLLPTMPSRRRTTAQAHRIAEANLRARAGRRKRNLRTIFSTPPVTKPKRPASFAPPMGANILQI